MATNHSSKRSATTLRCGNTKATIWQNVSENGPFFATTFSRPFKDQAGVWLNGTSLGLNDLEALMNVTCEAKEWITAYILNHSAVSWEGLLSPFQFEFDSVNVNCKRILFDKSGGNGNN